MRVQTLWFNPGSSAETIDGFDSYSGPELRTLSNLTMAEATDLLDLLEQRGIRAESVEIDENLCATISWFG